MNYSVFSKIYIVSINRYFGVNIYLFIGYVPLFKIIAIIVKPFIFIGVVH